MKHECEFTINDKILTLVSEISVLVGRVRKDFLPPFQLELRRKNRIRSIHSSLAIEGNTLSLKNVTDIIDGKKIVGNRREIQEVKGALAAYDLIDSLNPCSIEDLLKVHGILMWALVDNPGEFRDCGVGVFKGPIPVHIAPEAEDVPKLMNELMKWSEETDCHPLIKGCVFHCRFENIHPFKDGNGRMGRLWHSLILSKWNSIFSHLPIETWVQLNQQQYYDVLNKSNDGDMTEFILYMLEIIKMAMDEFVDESEYAVELDLSERERIILKFISKNPKITIAILAETMKLSDRTIKRHISSLVDKNVIRRVGSDKAGQWEII